MRITTIVGNRPQFVKAAAVSKVLREEHDETLIHTGQHYDDEMSRIFFEELEIPRPDTMLQEGSGSNTAQTARMIAALETVLQDTAPDVVLVYGDTNTTLAGAIVARQAAIPVAHVEAGMRSFDRSMPEEFNRVLTDHASDLLLCSTPVAVDNLRNEGVTRGVHLVGDVMADVALASVDAARRRSTILEDVGVTPGRYALVTAHRAANVDTADRLEKLVEVLEALPLDAVFPVHPRTRARLEEFGLHERLAAAGHMKLLPPVGYLDLLRLAEDADVILTDSGGLQKEAYLMATRCVTLRDTTEWVETVDVGWNRLVGLDREKALEALATQPPAERPDLYGEGRAAGRIRDVIGAWTG